VKEYDVITIGTGAASSVLHGMLQQNPRLRAAIIDKDAPGGICLTRGCIPSKLLLYPAELVRTVERAHEFGVDATVRRIRFSDIMARMRRMIGEDIESIRKDLSETPGLDYYPSIAEFVAPYTLQVGAGTIHSPLLLLGLGSEVVVPPIPGLREIGFLTSDTLLQLTELPRSVAVIGGGYIAAEYGSFLAAMGARVTILGRNQRFLPDEEPEISETIERVLSRHLTVSTGHVVTRIGSGRRGRKLVMFQDRSGGKEGQLEVEEILVASGRGPTTALLHPERGGIAVDTHGWIVTNDRLETSQKGVYALGDANGRFLFRHKANWEAHTIFTNLVEGGNSRVDYRAVPHAVFTEPEIAAVGLREAEAIERLGAENIRIGHYRFADTARGQSIGDHDGFVKVILEHPSTKILGAHIIGPQASILLQEIVDLMYTVEGTTGPILKGMHIHPALSEVVDRAVRSPMTVEEYRRLRSPPPAGPGPH
jgi:dihydrolipoamide dehydrogenase